MKNPPYFPFIVSLIVGVIIVMSSQAHSNDIVVQVQKIDVTKPGNLMVMLYAEEGFPKDHAKALSINVLPATKESIVVRFSSVPDEFAIKVLHDEDGTRQVSKNWTGIMPAEGLGFSNGAKVRFGPPKFAKAKLSLSKVNKPVTINLVYP